jgi:hypothetical protein
MEKAPDTQLFYGRGSMIQPDSFSIIKQLTKLESEFLLISFLASGHLYFKSHSEKD